MEKYRITSRLRNKIEKCWNNKLNKSVSREKLGEKVDKFAKGWFGYSLNGEWISQCMESWQIPTTEESDCCRTEFI